MNNKLKFKQKFTLEQRRQKRQLKDSQITDMIPVVVESHQRSKLPNLPKNVYLVSKDFKVSQFRQLIRNSLKLTSKQSIYFHCGDTLVNEDQVVRQLYETHQDPEDGFLYLTYSDLEVFG
ncbi:hypothetical protein pb186bvf_003488 [Paramecium bursaria]